MMDETTATGPSGVRLRHPRRASAAPTLGRRAWPAALALALACALAACAPTVPLTTPPVAPAPSRAAAGAAAGELLWLGQSAFRITTPGGRRILIDPWLKANPVTPAAWKDLQALGAIDVLLVTHGHGDHLGDAPEIARAQNIPMWAPGDLNATVAALGILPPAQAPRFNKSGTVEPAPGIRVTAVRAEHSSVLVWRNPATGRDETHVGGEPVGYLIELENGLRIWHMGDTGLFGDMRFIADYYKPDLVLMPIGGNFTMGPAEAAYAARELVRAPRVVPMHYGANPLGKGTPAAFEAALQGSGVRVQTMRPGETVPLPSPGSR